MVCWFPDNSVIVSFAVINQLPLLKAALHGKGRAVEAVVNEIEQSAARTPNMRMDMEEWFGVVIAVDDPTEIRKVEMIRRDQFGGTSSDHLEHLGESQTLFVIRNRPEYQSSIWITEDRQSYRFAIKQGLIARDTFDVLQDLVGMSEISPQQAYAIAQEILDADRPMMRPPKSYRDFQ